jgi:two-component system, NtrC family, nitrogen regulation sensor histidine kinase NtrY
LTESKPINIQKVSTKPTIKQVFRPKIAIRLLGISILGCLTGYLIFDSPYWMAAIWTALATIGLFYETIRFMDQSERKLAAFLQSLNQNDFSVTFSENRNTNDYDLHVAFNQLTETFKSLRSDKESQHQLLQIVVEHAAVPLICFDESNSEIFLVNNAAKELFNVPFLQKITSLARVDPTLPEFLKEIKDGEKVTFRLVIQSKITFLSVTSRHILFKEKRLKLIAFHDVSSELAMKEADTWQKLLRVLTHEISNSAIPLSTLSSYIREMLEDAQVHDRKLTDDERNDLMESLRTIDHRSQSLKEFVQNFRTVNTIPEPRLNNVRLSELVKEATHLFTKEFQNENICLQTFDLNEPVLIYADRNLTMQVLINLLKNAVEAMSNYKEQKYIKFTWERVGTRYINLHIADTGCGIAEENLEQIFIPFFSTKKSGSGIGLSISQQIMQRQKGDISVRSALGKGSAFTMTFSC